jgi:hypothetical protein
MARRVVKNVNPGAARPVTMQEALRSPRMSCLVVLVAARCTGSTTMAVGASSTAICCAQMRARVS